MHDLGKFITDLAMPLALDGDCLADIAVLRAEPELFGPVASDPVVSRLVARLAADAPRALKAIRAPRDAARERAWPLAGEAAPGAGGGLITMDIDTTIVTAFSEKEQAAATWKKPWGFHTLTAFADQAPKGPVSVWLSCCGLATPGATPPPGPLKDRIRCAKDTGSAQPPLHGFAANQIWYEIVALACEFLAWMQMLALTGPARHWEPKRQRLRIFSAAGRLVRGGRRLRLRLVADGHGLPRSPLRSAVATPSRQAD